MSVNTMIAQMPTAYRRRVEAGQLHHNDAMRQITEDLEGFAAALPTYLRREVEAGEMTLTQAITQLLNDKHEVEDLLKAESRLLTQASFEVTVLKQEIEDLKEGYSCS